MRLMTGWCIVVAVPCQLLSGGSSLAWHISSTRADQHKATLYLQAVVDVYLFSMLLEKLSFGKARDLQPQARMDHTPQRLSRTLANTSEMLPASDWLSTCGTTSGY